MDVDGAGTGNASGGLVFPGEEGIVPAALTPSGTAAAATQAPLGSLAAKMTVTSVRADGTRSEQAPMPAPPYRGPPVSAAGTQRVPGRNKVILEKGHSQMDWMNLTRRAPDLAGLGGGRPRKLTLDEVKQHNKPEDAWTVLRGKVYNMTAYLPFHPGGVPMLMSGAGRDCTSLFDKYHRWVNGEMLLERCLVGTLHDGLDALEEEMADAGLGELAEGEEEEEEEEGEEGGAGWGGEGGGGAEGHERNA